MSDPVAVEAAAISRRAADIYRTRLIACVVLTVIVVLFVPFGPVIATLGPGHGVHLGDLVFLPLVVLFAWCRARLLHTAAHFDQEGR